MALFPSLGLSPSDRSLFPELQALIEGTRAHPNATFPQLVPSIEAFLRSQFIKKFIIHELRLICNNPDYGRLADVSNIELVRFPQYTVQLGRLKSVGNDDVSNGAQVSSYANDILYCNLGPGAFSYELYRAPTGQRNELFDRTCHPVFVAKRTLQPGDIENLKAGCDIIKILPFKEDVFQVSVASRMQQSLEWHYDYDTLEPLYCSAGKNSSSAIQHALNILVKLGSTKAAPAFISAFKSDDHFVRWSAVRAALALDESVGHELLRRAKSDTHPHVRLAALKAEEMLQLDS